MKKMLMRSMAGFFLMPIFAQVKPPEAVKNAVNRSYPAISPVKWDKDDDEYEASFVQNGKKMSATYSPSGELKETETGIRANELPVAATRYIAQHYKNARLKTAEKVLKSNGETLDEAEINKKDIVFDQNGKFIKVEKD